MIKRKLDRRGAIASKYYNLQRGFINEIFTTFSKGQACQCNLFIYRSLHRLYNWTEQKFSIKLTFLLSTLFRQVVRSEMNLDVLF